MQHPTPTIYINVFRHWKTAFSKNQDGNTVRKLFTVDMPYERAVITDRSEAAHHAEEFADYYAYAQRHRRRRPDL